MPTLIVEWRAPVWPVGVDVIAEQRVISSAQATDVDELTDAIHGLLAKHMANSRLTVELHRTHRARSGRFRYDGHTRGHGTWKVQA